MGSIFPLRLLIKESDWAILWIVGGTYGLVVVPLLTVFAIIVRLERRRHTSTGRCQKCGYLLIRLPDPRCPECGTPFDPSAIPLVPRPRPLYSRFFEEFYLLAACAWAICLWFLSFAVPYPTGYKGTAVALTLSYLFVAAIPRRAIPMRVWIAFSVVCICLIVTRILPWNVRTLLPWAYIFGAPLLALATAFFRKLFAAPLETDA